jgi:acyl-CoA thioester hydrolase
MITPYQQIYTVHADDLDFLGHVNNKCYLDWMEKIAWAHAQSVGISQTLQRRLNRILAVSEHHLNYQASCYEGDCLTLKTWVGNQVGCCQRERYFEFVREHDQTTVFSARSLYVCISIDQHKARRIPKEFIDPYR